MGAQVVAPSTAVTIERNSYADLLRTVAVIGVVLGHWLVTAIVYRGGSLYGVDVLGQVRWTSWLTLLFQVVPLFFLVGGYANAVSWRRHSADGEHWGSWVRARTLRLLVPTLGYVVVVALAVAACEIGRANAGELSQAAWGVALHLWFLAAYGALLVCTPLLFEAHRRWGWRVLVVMIVLAVTIDVGVVEFRWHLVGWVNYLLVWGVFHQLGFAWQDGTFRQWWRPAGLAVISIGALVALVWWGPYPVSMVGVPGARIQNASPPSAALLAFGLAQSGVLLAVEPAVRRWLDERSRARSAITTAGAFTMPIYLWHMAPVVLVAVAGYPDHLVSQPRIGSGAWWLQRIIWVVALAIVLALVLTVISLATRLGRDRHKAAVPSSIHVNSGLLLAGAATAAYGTGRLAVDGFAPAGRLGPVPLVALAIGTLLVIGSAQVGYRTKPRASR